MLTTPSSERGAAEERARVVAHLRSEAAMWTFRTETCSEDMVAEFDLYRQSMSDAADAIERLDHLKEQT